MSSPHDRLFQAIFSQPRYARPLLRAALPAAIARRIDFRTLRLDKRSFIEERLRAHYTDLLFRVRIAGRSAYVYILFEHQSSIEVLMAVRLLVYMYMGRDLGRSPARASAGPARAADRADRAASWSGRMVRAHQHGRGV